MIPSLLFVCVRSRTAITFANAMQILKHASTCEKMLMQYYTGGGLASEDAREGVFVDKASRKNVLFLVGDDLRPNLGSYREVKMKQPFF